MHPGIRITLLIPLAILLGCGSSSQLVATSSSTTTNLTGNWEITSHLDSSGTIADFTGALQFNGSTVTGTFRALASNLTGNCPSFTTDLAVTGSVTTANSLSGTVNNLTLTIPISGGTATITAILPQNPQTFTPGSLQIVGGTCSMPATAMTIVQFAPVTGTYSGTLATSGTPAISATVTAALVQATTPNADGLFPLTGTLTIQGPCSATLPLLPETVSGIGISSPSGSSTSPASDLTGELMTPAATSIQAFTDIYDTNCSIGALQGTLTRQ